MLTRTAEIVPAPRVFRKGRLSPDQFTFVENDAELPDGPVIVSLQRFVSERANLLLRGKLVGVRLETSESLELLAAHIGQVALVEIHIPYFKDGRAFSAARKLRTRLQFRGEVRLTGHFLLDQIAFFQRVGVDSFALPANVSAAQIEMAIGSITEVYQPSVDGRATIGDLRLRSAAAGIAAE